MTDEPAATTAPEMFHLVTFDNVQITAALPVPWDQFMVNLFVNGGIPFQNAWINKLDIKRILRLNEQQAAPQHVGNVIAFPGGRR